MIADEALNRLIVDVDDSDTFVCQPHSPGELREALIGRTLTAAHRRGKAMWLETSGTGGSQGPDLGIHLGMGGRIVVTSKDGQEVEGGGPRRRDAQPRRPNGTGSRSPSPTAAASCCSTSADSGGSG